MYDMGFVWLKIDVILPHGVVFPQSMSHGIVDHLFLFLWSLFPFQPMTALYQVGKSHSFLSITKI